MSEGERNVPGTEASSNEKLLFLRENMVHLTNQLSMPIIEVALVISKYIRIVLDSLQKAAIEEGATRYLETDFLLNRGIETYGFIDVGIGANAWGADWNGPITFNDRAWQGQMNQLYLINERILKEDQLSLGGRVDLLYGTDFLYTVAGCLLYTSPSPRDKRQSRMPSSA